MMSAVASNAGQMLAAAHGSGRRGQCLDPDQIPCVGFPAPEDHANSITPPLSKPGSATRSCRAREVQLAVHAWVPGIILVETSFLSYSPAARPAVRVIFVVSPRTGNRGSSPQFVTPFQNPVQPHDHVVPGRSNWRSMLGYLANCSGRDIIFVKCPTDLSSYLPSHRVPLTLSSDPGGRSVCPGRHHFRP
jgi:hypothetical protein